MSSFDRAIHFGDAVYETIFCYKGLFLSIDSHLERLGRSLQKTNITSPIPLSAFTPIMSYLAENNSQQQIGYSFLCISRGLVSHRSLTSYGESSAIVQFFPKRFAHGTVSLTGVLDDRWRLPSIKSTSLLPNVLGAIKAQAQQTLGLFINSNNHVTEGTHFNIFALIDDVLVTPPSDGSILAGCTRNIILKCAENIGIPYQERILKKEELFKATTLIASSSLMHVAHVAEMEGHRYNLHPITQQLRLEYNKYFDVPTN